MVYNVAAVVAKTAAGIVYTFVRFLWGFFRCCECTMSFKLGITLHPSALFFSYSVFFCLHARRSSASHRYCTTSIFVIFILGSLVAYEFAYSPVIWLFPHSTRFRLEKKKKTNKQIN